MLRNIVLKVHSVKLLLVVIVVTFLFFLCLLNIQSAPEQFTLEEFPITESKVSMDVNFPGAAFVVVSCKESQLSCRKE